MAWNRLPEPVLAHIYGYLDQRDRVAASEVCMSWHHALYAPFLWRAMRIHLDRDLLQAADPELRTVNEPIALHLAYLFGQHLRHLELVWPRLSLPRLQFPRGAQVEAGIAFLALLRYQNVQLKGLALTDWIFSNKLDNRGKLLNKLVKFLNSQRNLEILSMKNACFGLGEAMRLLTAVVKENNYVMYRLDICGAFKHWKIANSNAKYLWSLQHLKALTNIRLDYSALSDEVLSIFSQQAVLTYLHVSVRVNENRRHVLSDHAWNLLRTACPNLKVSLSLVNIAYYETICRYLLPSIPLCKFQLLSDSIMYRHLSRYFRSTVRLLLRYYADTLESIHLRIKDTHEMLDDLLLQLLTKCPHLSHLQYEGILCNMETVRQMCILQDNKMTNFHTMHVKPRILNTTNQQIVRDIRSQFANKLAEQHVDFQLQDP